MSWDRRDWLALLGLAVAPLIYFWRLFVPGPGRQYFESGDFVDQFYAFAAYETRALAAGELPLWNPFAYSGTPFWADIQSAVAYPPSLATVLASIAAMGRMPFVALELEAVAHYALAGVFTYLFARRVVGSRSAALIAAATFTFGGYLTGYPALQLAVLESNVWLPLALLGAAMTVSSAWGIPVLAIALGMGVLAGHPQSALYLIYAAAAYFAWSAWPWRAGGPRPWLRLGAATALGLGLAAAGWLPALEYMRLSNRAAVDYATVAHGFPPREILGVALAGITKWAPLYVGVLPLMLAVTALRDALTHGGRLAREARFWSAMGGLALVLSLGGGSFVFDVFYLVAPGFDLFRGQERAAFVLAFSLAMLAGIGFAAWRSDRRGADRVIAIGALILAGLGLAVAAVGSPELRTTGVRLAVFAGAAALVAFGHARGRLRGHALTAVALALIGFDLYSAGSLVNLQPNAPGELQTAAIVEAMQAENVGRVQNDDRMPRNFGVLHGVESVYGASPLRVDKYDTLYEGLMPDHESRLWSLTGVSHVLTWRGELGEPSEVVATEGEGDTASYLHALASPKPLVWRVGGVEAVTDEGAAIDRLRDPSFDPGAVALIHDGETGLGSLPATPGNAEIVSRTPREVVARTRGDGPGWLVFAEVHYPGWQAAVDGAQVDIARADVALMAVAVPEGEHDVRLSFGAPTVRAGIIVSLLSGLLLAVLVAWLYGRSRHAAT